MSDQKSRQGARRKRPRRYSMIDITKDEAAALFKAAKLIATSDEIDDPDEWGATERAALLRGLEKIEGAFVWS